jgi:hypothetical protein
MRYRVQAARAARVRHQALLALALVGVVVAARVDLVPLVLVAQVVAVRAVLVAWELRAA